MRLVIMLNVMMNAIMVSVIIMSIVRLNIILLNVAQNAIMWCHYDEYRYHYAEHHFA